METAIFCRRKGASATDETQITGTVENIVYRNDETGFAVLDLGVGDELVTVAGEMYGVSEGEELTVYGEYTVHPTFGRQFKATGCQRNLPSGAGAILRYLSGGAISGVGPAIARRLVDAFGDDTLDVLAKHTEKLMRIKGIS